MIMSYNFHYYERHRNDLSSKMANLINHVQQRQKQQHQQPVVASKRRFKMQGRFVILLLLLTLVSTYQTAASLATTINKQHQLANITGASSSSSYRINDNSKVDDNFASLWFGNSSMPNTFTNNTETTVNDMSKNATNLLGHQGVVGLGDYYGTLFSFGFDRLVSILVDELFELNETVELDCSRGMRRPSLSSTAAKASVTAERNQLNSPFINHPVTENSQRFEQGRRLKRSSGFEPEVEPDATLIDTIGGAQIRKGEGNNNHRVHREATLAKRGSLQMIRSVNPSRDVTHMNMMMGDVGRDTATSPGHSSAAPASHLHEIDQDHLYDERNFDRTGADDSLRHKSNRKARRQSSSSSSGARKDRMRHLSSSTTMAPSTSTTATGPSTGPTQAAVSMAQTVVSERGFGTGESTLEPATANPDQSAEAAVESGNVESPISELAMPQPTEQPASVYNDLDSIDEPQNQRPVNLPPPQQQQQTDDGGSAGQLDATQVELLPRRARLDKRQRANLMAGGDHQQRASQVPASLSAQIPPPEQSPLKSTGTSSSSSHHNLNHPQHSQHQKSRHLPTGNLVFSNNGYSNSENSNNNTDQQPDLVPQVGDAQVLENSHATAGGSTKEQQLRQLLRLYEMNENSLANRLKGRQSNTSNNHNNQNRVSSIASLGEYPAQHQSPYLTQRQLYHYQQQLNGDGAVMAAAAGGASSPQMVVRSQAPYAVPNNGVSGPTTMSQPSSYFNGENYPQIPQALAALDSIDGGGASVGVGVGGPQITQQALKNYMRPSSAAATALSGQIHRPGASAVSVDAASQIEENFYNSNNKYAAALAHMQQQQQQQQQQQLRLQEEQMTLNNNNIELQPSTKLRRATGSTNSSGSSKQALNLATNQATNKYGSRGNRVTSLQAIDASQTPDHGQLVQGLLRASNPIAYGSTMASSTIRAQHSSPLLRRTSPLIALPASGNNNQQLAFMGAPYRGVATTAYLLPAGYSPSLPYSSTSARYTKQSNANGSIQRKMVNTGSQHRMGKIANSNGAANSASNNNNYDDSPSGSSTQASVSSTATSDPMWSDTQNQEDDYQQAPQTIQITAVPNGFGGGLWNGGVNGFNPLVGAGWNGGWGGPWNGRQVLLVNKQPAQTVGSSGGLGSEWRQWVLPVAAVLALPLILGALFVPVFLKSIMFLIQILQMLGLLMPPAQLAGHLASSSHTTSSG